VPRLASSTEWAGPVTTQAIAIAIAAFAELDHSSFTASAKTRLLLSAAVFGAPSHGRTQRRCSESQEKVAKGVKLSADACEKLLHGINNLANALRAMLAPRGGNVVLASWPFAYFVIMPVNVALHIPQRGLSSCPFELAMHAAVYHRAMRSLTCLLESHVYSSKNLRSTVQKDFCNKICHKWT
jgi:hypothetical protein